MSDFIKKLFVHLQYKYNQHCFNTKTINLNFKQCKTDIQKRIEHNVVNPLATSAAPNLRHYLSQPYRDLTCINLCSSSVTSLVHQQKDK